MNQKCDALKKITLSVEAGTTPDYMDTGKSLKQWQKFRTAAATVADINRFIKAKA